MTRLASSRLAWIAAAVSLGVGVTRGLMPTMDFTRVMQWVQELLAGRSPYRPDWLADYPPWAILTLAPLGSLPDSWQLPVWVAINVGLACWLAWAISRDTSKGGSGDGLVIALLLCASCFRVLNQFSLISMALAWAGVRQRSPWIGGVLLGVSLMKPQVGGVFLVAHLLMGDWRRVSIAMAVPVGMTAVVTWMLGLSPVELLQQAAQQLVVAQGSVMSPAGHTELRAWVMAFWPEARSLWFAAVVGVLLGLPAFRRVWREGAKSDMATRMALYGFLGAVSLLSVRHLSYDFVLLLPLLASWRDRPAFWALWLPLVLQVPGWWRQVLEPLGAPAALAILVEADRILALTVWAVLRRSPK